MRLTQQRRLQVTEYHQLQAQAAVDGGSAKAACVRAKRDLEAARNEERRLLDDKAEIERRQHQLEETM